MERVAEPKLLPRNLPILVEVSKAHTSAARESGQRLNRQEVSGAAGISLREVNQLSKTRDVHVPISHLASLREVAQLTNARIYLVQEDMGFDARSSGESLTFEPTMTWKGKGSSPEDVEFVPDVETMKESSYSIEDGGPSLFAGASHPPEPVDTDLMRTVYVPIGQNKSEAGCLIKNMPSKGPFLEDLSIRVPAKKPSPAVLSPEQSLVEELNGIGNLAFLGPRASPNTENSLLPPDAEEKECVWDASLPPSGNVSPLSSIDSTGVVTAMSIVNSCASTYRSDAMTSDGMLSLDRNCDSTKGSVRGDSLESAKTSASRASDSSGEGSITEDDSGDHVTDLLHVMKSLSALGDVLSSLTSKKDIVPYENSVLTKLLADSLGGSSKTLMIVNVCPSVSNLSETLSSLNFSARARNSMLSLGNRDTIKKWRDVANDARKELYDKEKEINDLKQEGLELKQALKDANDQCVLLFNEVQKAWKVSSALQTDLKSEHEFLSDKHNIEKEQNTELRNQVAQLLRLEQDQKLQIQEQDSTIQSLQAKIRTLETQLNESIKAQPRSIPVSEPESADVSNSKLTGDGIDSSAVTRKLEEELKKRDALIERLHEENEKLFDRLTQSQKASTAGSPKLSSPLARGSANVQPRSTGRNGSGNNTSSRSVDVLPSPLATDKNDGTVALVKTGSELVKSTPAGEYLTAALNDFDPDQYEGHAAISDGANKLLMLVLAAVIKAGASREHEILAEIRDSVFSFIRKMEPKRVMDTMLVSRVRILYIRSLLARSPELQSIKVLPVECFLEKTNTGRSRSSSRGSSPGRSPVLYVDEQIQGFKVNLKPEKKSKFSSVVLKIRGIDEDIWRQQVTGGKLREITEEAKSFAMGNKALAALFVHTPAGELQRQIRSWLGENFEFLSVTGDDASGGSTGQLELLSTAIMDGWMAGLGAALPPHTDALGQLLFEYSKRVYTSQLQHLKDIAGTLATEEAEDAAQVAKLRSALESVDHKRRKILQQMKSDIALLTLENGGSPIQNPSTAAEDARLASLISLDSILKQIKDITRLSSVNILSKSKKKTMLASVDELTEQMPSLLQIDHPCAQRHIADARYMVESIPEEDDPIQDISHGHKPSTDLSSGSETDVAQWNVLQFNTGSTLPFIIKCGANSNSELVIKADARVQEPKGGEIVRVAPRPSVLENMNLEEMKQVFNELPEALSLLALARTADGTRARYSRLYRTLATKVPSLKDLVSELEKGGALKDVRT